MKFLEKISVEWVLRLGLGFMYLYSGYDLFMSPKGWTWVLPSWFSVMVNQIMPVETYLRLQGAAELTMAFILLAWFLNHNFVKAVAVVSAAEFIFILLFSTQLSITFRDIGLLGAASALLITTFSCTLPKETSGGAI